MDFECDRELLVEAMNAAKRLTVSERTFAQNGMLLQAKRAPGEASAPPGCVHVWGRSLLGAGVVAQIPARVTQEGCASLPAEPLREYAEMLRSASVQVWSAESSDAASRSESGGSGKKNGPPLQLESHFVSERGAISTSQAQFCTWMPEEAFLPPLERWQERAIPLGHMDVTVLRQGIRPCTTLANTAAKGKRDAPEMAGVLLTIEGDALLCWATTGYTLVKKRLPFRPDGERPLGEQINCSALFSGAALMRISETLPEEAMVQVSLVAEERPLLLLTAQQKIWYCQSLALPAPRSWLDFPSLPILSECQVRRKDLRAALQELCIGDPAALSFQVREGMLCLAPFVRRDVANACELEVYSEKQVALSLRPAGDFTGLVQPRQLKQLIDWLGSASALLRIQIGQFERRFKSAPEQVRFLRILSSQDVAMMSLSAVGSVTAEHNPLSPSQARDDTRALDVDTASSEEPIPCAAPA